MPRRLARRAAREASSELSSAPSDIAEPAHAATGTAKIEEEKASIAAATRKPKLVKPTEKAAKTAPAAPTAEKATTGESGPATGALKRKRPARKEPVKKEPVEDEARSATPNTTRRKKTVKVEEEAAQGEDEDEEDVPLNPTKRTKVKSTQTIDHQVTEKKAVRKRKTKEEKEAEAMPLAARTLGHKMYIGAHVSSAGGVPNSVTNALHIGANAFALFLKSQRKWANPPLDPSQASTFHAHCKNHSYNQHSHVVPHGSYLVNLAHTDPDRTKQAYDAFVDDLHRCEKLGIALYNFHPGNSVGGDRTTAIAHLARNLNRAHKETSTVVTLLENMAAGGNVLGSTFEDLRDVIALVDDKTRVGVCLDTCHAFAAGYDLRTEQALDATLARFDSLVGIEYLRALHLNDSKAPFQSHRDLHANIGTGFLGLRAFHAVMNEPRFHGLPMVLETPIEVRDLDGNLVKDAKGKETEDKGIWAREIKLLESLVDMDVDSDEFNEAEHRLQKMGAAERSRVADQVERRGEKQKAAQEKKGRGKATANNKKKTKTKKDEDDGSDGSALSELDSE
ncbi:hypothetical protein MBLNU459_g1808t1 [Dothideomycetes sp. NU459]